jgi:hypothetical protein
MRFVLAIAALAFGLIPNIASAQRGERSDSRREERRDDNDRDDDDRDGGRREERRASREEPPLTPGFGEAATLPGVPGFGIDAGASGGARNQGIPLADRFHPNVVGYVDQVLRRYDRNGNGKLERDEWSAARWRSDPASSDLNKDGILTREELCERVKTYDEFRGLSNSASSGGGSG